MPKVSIVMPAYNVERYIGQAIDSIIMQSITDWELIIVDDCSNDDTVRIAEQYSQKYENIRIILRKKNSGGARLPRFDGILAAKGEFVCPVDADDMLEKKYLKKILVRQAETGAEIVLGRMMICNKNMNLSQNRMIPKQDFDMTQVLNGIDACKMTIDDWAIAMAGMLANSDIYKGYVNVAYNDSFNLEFADELDQRKLLLLSPKIAMVNAHYLYRQHPSSIVHDTSIKSFNALVAIQNLYEFVEKEFKDDAHIIRCMQNKYIDKVYRHEIIYWNNRNKYTKAECDDAKKHLRSAYRLIAKKKMKCHLIKHRLIGSSYIVMRLIAIMANLYGKIRRERDVATT